MRMKSLRGLLALVVLLMFAVRESCAAEKYRETGNVGIIGIALFNEIGSNLGAMKKCAAA
jgi:hypothetical protein